MQKGITFERFSGLRLDLPLNEVGPEQAIALLDVEPGPQLKLRPGLEAWNKTEGAESYDRIFPHSRTRLLARRGGNLRVFSSESKKETEASLKVGKEYLDFAALGTPTNSYTYIAMCNQGTIGRFDGTNFASPTATVNGTAGKAMPYANFLETWPDGGNRLVVLGTPSGAKGPGGATSSPSHVWFPQPGNPEEWNTEGSEAHPANYVQLAPGDGEEIVGGCYWSGQLFVFKERKLFVFYGVGVDEEGHPEFLYRMVNLGCRVTKGTFGSGANVVAGRDGVYFVSVDLKLWVTTGSTPICLSEQLRPLSESPRLLPPPAHEIFSSVSFADGIQFLNDCIYISLTEDVSEEFEPALRILKFDITTSDWTVYTSSLYDMVPWKGQVSGGDRIFASSGKWIYYYTTKAAEDPTVEMKPLWQSGFYDLGSADEKQLSMVRLFGKGKASLRVAKDFGSVGAATTKTLTAATTPTELREQAIAQARFNKSQKGVLFSHRFEGEEGKPFELHRLARYLRVTRVPGTEEK